MRSLAISFIFLLAAEVCATPPAWARNGSAEAALTKLDLKQKEMVAKADVAGLAEISAPGLTINAPTNRVLSASSS